MYFLLSVWAIVAAVWVLVIVKRWKSSDFRISFAIVGFFIVVVGSVFGYEFFKIDKGPIPLTLDRVMLAVMMGVFGCFCLRRRAEIRALDATDWFIGALILFLIFSVFITDWKFANNRPISRLIFFYLMPVGLYFVVKNTQIREFDLKFIAVGFAFFGLYLAVTAVAESSGFYSLVLPPYIGDEGFIEFFGRGRGPFLNPVSNGIFLTVGTSLAILLWWQSGVKFRIPLAFIIPFLVLGSIATLTRSVWLGLLVAVGLIVWIPATRRQRAAVVLTAGIAGLAFVLAFGDSLFSFKRDKHVSAEQMSESAQLRPIFVTVAWEMFKDRPLMGCGFGQYGRARHDYVLDPTSQQPLRKARSYLQHNVFLSFITETGLIGCGLLILFLIKIYLVSWSLWKNQSASSWTKCYALLMIGTLTAWLINGMFHDVSICPMVNMLLFFLLAIVVNLQTCYGLERAAVTAEKPFETSEFQYAYSS